MNKNKITEQEKVEIMEGLQNVDFEELKEEEGIVQIKVKKSKNTQFIDKIIETLKAKAKKNNKLSYLDIDQAILLKCQMKLIMSIDKIYEALESEGIEIIEKMKTKVKKKTLKMFL